MLILLRVIKLLNAAVRLRGNLILFQIACERIVMCLSQLLFKGQGFKALHVVRILVLLLLILRLVPRRLIIVHL